VCYLFVLGWSLFEPQMHRGQSVLVSLRGVVRQSAFLDFQLYPPPSETLSTAAINPMHVIRLFEIVMSTIGPLLDS
jgi:hypothetical protein